MTPSSILSSDLPEVVRDAQRAVDQRAYPVGVDVEKAKALGQGMRRVSDLIK